MGKVKKEKMPQKVSKNSQLRILKEKLETAYLRQDGYLQELSAVKAELRTIEKWAPRTPLFISAVGQTVSEVARMLSIMNSREEKSNG